MLNTFENGQLRVLVYKEKDNDVWYATALELNLTVDSVDKASVTLELYQAIGDYIQSAKEVGDETLLNQVPDPEIVALWKQRISNEVPLVGSPYIPFSASVEKLGV